MLPGHSKGLDTSPISPAFKNQQYIRLSNKLLSLNSLINQSSESQGPDEQDQMKSQDHQRSDRQNTDLFDIEDVINGAESDEQQSPAIPDVEDSHCYQNRDKSLPNQILIPQHKPETQPQDKAIQYLPTNDLHECNQDHSQGLTQPALFTRNDNERQLDNVGSMDMSDQVEVDDVEPQLGVDVEDETVQIQQIHKLPTFQQLVCNTLAETTIQARRLQPMEVQLKCQLLRLTRQYRRTQAQSLETLESLDNKSSLYMERILGLKAILQQKDKLIMQLIKLT